MNYKLVILGLSIILILLGIFIAFSTDESLNIKIEWSNSFGGDEEDVGAFVSPLSEGGCVVVGNTNSYGSGMRDVWLLKANESGALEWNRTYGGAARDFGKAVLQTNDHGFIIVGTTESYGSGWDDIWLIKVNETGIEEWNKTFGGVGWEEGNSIVETTDGGYIITGMTNSFGAGGMDYDVWLIKINEIGYEDWNKTYGGWGYEEGRSIKKTNDGYVIVGRTTSFGSVNTSNIWLFKVDEFGNELWNRTYDSENYDLSNDVIVADDGSFVIAGHRDEVSSGKWRGLVIKTGSQGNIEWERVIKEKANCGLSSVAECQDGYITIGYVGDYGPQQDLLVSKLDKHGAIIGSKNIGGNYLDAGVWINRIKNNSYFITGYSDENNDEVIEIWLIKMIII